MSYQINNSDYNEYGSSCDEYTNTLIKENQQLNILNNKLHKRCLNQKRKILRLKKIIEQSKDIAVNLESNIEDEDIWEDVHDVLESYKELDGTNTLDTTKADMVKQNKSSKTDLFDKQLENNTILE